MDKRILPVIAALCWLVCSGNAFAQNKVMNAGDVKNSADRIVLEF